MSLPNPAELISQMAIRLKAHLEHRGISEPRYIGIRTGGVWVAEALLAQLPPGWRGRFVPSRYDQGHQGSNEALHLERIG